MIPFGIIDQLIAELQYRKWLDKENYANNKQ